MAKLKRGKGTTIAQKQWYVMDKNKDRRAAVPAEEPLGYEYTWAWDMATVTASDGHFDRPYHVASEYAGPNGVGYRVAGSSSTASDTLWNDAMLDNTTHSAGTGGMPDDSIPMAGETSHPGRYLSWVVTIDQFDITSPTTIFAPLSWQLQTRNGAATLFGLPFFPAGYGPVYVNGVGVTTGTWGVQSDYDGLIGNISTITYDMSAAAPISSSDDDPSGIKLYPIYPPSYSGSAVVDYDITYHGAIFSATPPNVTSLPVHTSSPSI